MASIFAAGLLAALASFVLGRLLIRQAPRLGLQDLPNARSSHRVPTARGGGTGIVAAFLLALPLGLPGNLPGSWNVLLPLAAGVMLALVGLADDLRSLGLAVRLTAQALAVSVVLASLGWGAASSAESDIGLLSIVMNLPAVSEWLSVHAPPGIVMTLDLLLLPVLLLGGLWWINLFNFMDGIDGLASTQALFMILAALILRLQEPDGDGSLAVLTAPVSVVGLVLAGAVTGFLLLNWPPARLFMGDSGSLFLGFSLFSLAAHDVTYGNINLWSWLVLGSLFIVDATVTLLRRWISGQHLTDAHRSHLYQHLSRRWGSHGKVALVYCLINVAWVFPLALLAQHAPGWGPVLVLTACLPTAVFAWRAGAGLTETKAGR
ncbi:MAG TPA: glycosyltransferase family 4 protein [Lautropia sp.]|nr:glycosyltransferase family 4 protein [Lautropia sp.]